MKEQTIPERGFSKGLLGKIKAIADRSQLLQIGGRFDGKPAKSTILLQELPDINAFADIDRQKLPGVVEALTQPVYTEGIGGFDAGNLVDIAALIAKGDGNVAIRTVFGATERMPLRALSYLIPGLSLLQCLSEQHVSLPQLQIVLANHIGTALNGMSAETVRTESMAFVKAAQAFIAEAFPTVAGNTIFLEDVPLTHESSYRRQLGDIAAEVTKSGSLLVAALVEKGDAHGSQEAEYYGAAHVLLHDTAALELLQPLVPHQVAPIVPDAIISVGGKQEGLFYHLRFNLLRDIIGAKNNGIKTLQLFTKHHVPPYYVAQGGDVLLTGQHTADTIAPTAQHDLRLLNAYVSVGGRL